MLASNIHYSSQLESIIRHEPDIGVEIFSYVLQDIELKPYELDIDLLAQLRTGARLMPYDFSLPSTEWIERITALRLVCRSFNDQINSILKKLKNNDNAPAIFSYKFSEILNIYEGKQKDRDNKQKVYKDLLNNIKKLLSKQTIVTEAGEKHLHLGVNIRDIYVNVRDWDVFCGVLDTIAKQENIKTLKLEAPFACDVDNVTKTICTFLENIVQNERNLISAVRLNFSNNNSPHCIFRFSYLEKAFESMKERKITIQELNFGRTWFQNEDIQKMFDSLYDINALEYLSLRGNPGSDPNSGLNSISDSEQDRDQSIEISYQALAHNKVLRALDLSYRSLHEKDFSGLINLVKGRPFEFLCLQGLKAEHIAKLFEEIIKNSSCIHIDRLDLSRSVIGEHGMQCLKELLDHNVHLNEIILRECQFECSKQSLALINILASGIAKNSSIKRLNMWGIDIGIDGLEALLDQGLKSNTTLRKLEISSQAKSVKGDPYGRIYASRAQNELMKRDPRLVFGI